MKRVLIVGLLVMVVVALSACAAGPNDMAGTENEEGDIAGFWLGFWHGFIAPITFIISLFNDNVSIYEIHNNGGWYNFGFLLGLGTAWGGSGIAISPNPTNTGGEIAP